VIQTVPPCKVNRGMILCGPGRIGTPARWWRRLRGARGMTKPRALRLFQRGEGGLPWTVAGAGNRLRPRSR